MELLQELIKKILYLIPIILIASLLFVILRFVFKSMNVSPTLRSYVSRDFIPAPTLIGGSLGSAPTPSDKQTMPSMEELNPGMIVGSSGSYNYDGNTVDYTQANSQVRDISIGGNNIVHSGVIISGTAREIFFNNGKFFIAIQNKTGQVIATTVATANRAGKTSIWIPWQAKIGILSQQVPGECTLVLQNQNSVNGNPNSVKTIRIPARCE